MESNQYVIKNKKWRGAETFSKNMFKTVKCNFTKKSNNDSIEKSRYVSLRMLKMIKSGAADDRRLLPILD